MIKRAILAWIIWELVTGTIATVGGFAYPFLVHAGIIKQDYLKILPSFILPSHADTETDSVRRKCQMVTVTGTEAMFADGRIAGTRWRFAANEQPKCKGDK
jgi:hypothetical protein